MSQKVNLIVKNINDRMNYLDLDNINILIKGRK